MWTDITDGAQEVRLDPAVIQKGIALGCRAIANDDLAGAPPLDEELERGTFDVSNGRGEAFVPPEFEQTGRTLPASTSSTVSLSDDPLHHGRQTP
jgi:hypothetical protein